MVKGNSQGLIREPGAGNVLERDHREKKPSIVFLYPTPIRERVGGARGESEGGVSV